MLGLWEEAVSDLHMASKLDYDEEISIELKKVISFVSLWKCCITWVVISHTPLHELKQMH